MNKHTTAEAETWGILEGRGGVQKRSLKEGAPELNPERLESSEENSDRNEAKGHL